LTNFYNGYIFYTIYTKWDVVREAVAVVLQAVAAKEGVNPVAATK